MRFASIPNRAAFSRTHATAAAAVRTGMVPSGAGAQSYSSTKDSIPSRAKARATGAPSRIEQNSYPPPGQITSAGLPTPAALP